MTLGHSLGLCSSASSPIKRYGYTMNTPARFMSLCSCDFQFRLGQAGGGVWRVAFWEDASLGGLARSPAQSGPSRSPGWVIGMLRLL